LVDEQADLLSLLYRLRVEGLIVRHEDVEFLARPILRENIPADRELLAEGFAVRLENRLPLAADPGIEVSPAGWGRMPYLPLRIYVRVAALPPQQGQTP